MTFNKKYANRIQEVQTRHAEDDPDLFRAGDICRCITDSDNFKIVINDRTLIVRCSEQNLRYLCTRLDDYTQLYVYEYDEFATVVRCDDSVIRSVNYEI